jgi:tetratricopeptide (TPR) repeat protein
LVRPALVLALLLATPSAALAQPSLWQRARDPETARAEVVSRVIERLLDARSETRRDEALERDFALAAVAAADLAGAEKLPGTRLRCLHGIALVDAGLYRRAHQVLSRAIADSPVGPLAVRCQFAASIAAAHLGHTAIEVEALTAAIELGFLPDEQAQSHCNRAEAWMRRGELQRSIADYRRGIALGTEPALQALCYYGLAVALDRGGDTPSAWQALDVALKIRLPLTAYESEDALELPDVFFVPDYEVHYYKALSRMAAARQASDEEKRELYTSALGHWQAYLSGGEQAADPWLTQARLHAATCRRKLDEPAAPAAKRRKRLTR